MNEAFLLRSAHRLMDGKWSAINRTLVFSGTAAPGQAQAHWHSHRDDEGGDGGEGSRAAVELEDIVGVVFPWRAGGREVGVDRLLLTARPTSGGVEFVVTTLQLKTGAAHAKLTAGVVATARRKDNGNVDDSTLAGILVKMERGIAELVGWLCACFPYARFVVGEASVFTTKGVADGLERFRTQHPDLATRWHMEASLAAPLLLSAGAAAAEGLTYPWRAVGGLEWVAEALELQELDIVRKYYRGLPAP
jgi:hypothetical protein